MPTLATPPNELQIKGTLTNSTSGEVLLKNKVINVTAKAGGSEDGVINVGTTEETFTFSFIEDQGILWIENLDATNFIQVGIAASTYSIKLLAGYFAIIPMDLTANTLYLKANTAACDLKYKA